ncbi:MAG: hypothetical protein OEW15_15055 [Nitrospirota bacterium]|nr:hypothetical protein [Nitrospirota bacterium]
MAALQGVHGGAQGGRSCRVIEGALRGGGRNTSPALENKYSTCSCCDF